MKAPVAFLVLFGSLAVAPTGTAEVVNGGRAFDAAREIAHLGPRPAASVGERRAHTKVLGAFRAAGLRTEVQRFRVPGRGRSRNVIGILDTPAHCLRIVMAHADTTTPGPGANDNASGTGAVIALSAQVADLGARCDVWLVATGAEERIYTGSPDHLGALALARRVRARGLKPRLRWALSMDEVGRGPDFWLRSPVRRPRRGVEVPILRAARAAGASVRWVPDPGTGNSDHREFELLGMPAAKLGVGARGEPCRHLACDRGSRLDRRAFARALRVVRRSLRAR